MSIHGNPLAAQFECAPIGIRYLRDRGVSGKVDRLRHSIVDMRLEGGLNAEMLLRRDASLEKRDPARFRARALRLGRARLQALEARRERERAEQEPRGAAG